MIQDQREFRIAEWRGPPPEHRGNLKLLKSEYRNLSPLLRWFLVPAALLCPFVALALAPAVAGWFAFGSLCLLLFLNTQDVRARRKKVQARGGSDGYTVHITLSRYTIKYGEDQGTLRFVDDFLVFEGEKTTFSFDCSSLRERADVYAQLPNTVPTPYLLLDTPGRPIGVSFVSIEPGHFQREPAQQDILRELQKFRKQRAGTGIVNVLPPLEPLPPKEHITILPALMVVGALAYYPVLVWLNARNADHFWTWSGLASGLVTGFFIWLLKRLSQRNREVVFSGLRREAEDVRRRTTEPSPPPLGPL